ncbi:MAG: membrane dipeptidase [Pseudomonadota bacterium]
MRDETDLSAPGDDPGSATDLVFDGHNDTVLRLELAARSGTPRAFAAGPRDGTARLAIDLPRARAGGFAGGLFALFTPALAAIAAAEAKAAAREAPTGSSEASAPPQASVTALAGRHDPVPQPEALAFTTALLARLRRLAAEHRADLALATDAPGLRRAMAEGRIAMLAHVEGAECIDPDLAGLEVLHAAGLRSLGPVWSRTNAFGHGAPMTAQQPLEPGDGLTDAGRALVAGCEALGILVDCAHMTEQGFWDTAKISDQPLVVSHSNVHAICPSARNLTDRQLDAVAERDGLVGLNFHVAFLRPDCRHDTDTGLDVMLRHLDHMIDRLGEHGVAFGSDFDGCLLPRAIGDVRGLQALTGAMRRAGYGEALIARIARENWLDMLERVLPGPPVAASAQTPRTTLDAPSASP